MTSLTDLPKELIVWTADLLGPVDCFNLAITNKYFSGTLSLVIKKHQDGFRKYTQILVDTLPNLWDLVCNIIKDPSIGQYIRSVEMNEHDTEYDPGQWINGQMIPGTAKPPKEQTDLVLEAAHRDPILGKWLRDTNPTNNFTSELLDGQFEPIVAVFLTLLPEVRRFSYTDHVDTTSIDAVLDGLGLAYSKSAPYLTSLKKLNDVSITHWDTENGVPFGTATSLMFLPAVRTFKGWAVAEERDHNDPPAGTIKTYVEHVDFEHSCVDHQLMREWLACTVALKRFSYVHGGATVGYSAFHPRCFAKHLLDYTTETLELMHLEDDDMAGEEWDDTNDEPLPSPVSLATFKRLKSLRCDLSVFRRNPDDESDQEQRDDDDDEPLEEGFHQEDQNGTLNDVAFDLTSMLPSTLTELELNEVSEKDMKSIKKFARSMKENFPLLEKFRINREPFQQEDDNEDDDE